MLLLYCFIPPFLTVDPICAHILLRQLLQDEVDKDKKKNISLNIKDKPSGSIHGKLSTRSRAQHELLLGTNAESS